MLLKEMGIRDVDHCILGSQVPERELPYESKEGRAGSQIADGSLLVTHRILVLRADLAREASNYVKRLFCYDIFSPSLPALLISKPLAPVVHEWDAVVFGKFIIHSHVVLVAGQGLVDEETYLEMYSELPILSCTVSGALHQAAAKALHLMLV